MAKEIVENIDLDNPEFQNAWSLINHTNQSVFLTGKAGTGKSTFLKYICAHTRKRFVVLAPTGIAAVNVCGVTMHSFFKMPFKPLLPDDPDYSARKIRQTMRLPREKVKLLKELDLIIIDEISMVRCDMIDFMDRVLRIFSENMREPFGGKQLLLVGDIFQLEPVVTPDMKEILRRYYKNFFFFNANAFSEVKLVPIELRKIYRQTDSEFISLLDRVRVNRATKRDLQLINSRCMPLFTEDKEQMVMTLASRRDTVDSINEEHMNSLTTKEYSFVGEIEGVFPEQNLPTASTLVIKEGAQVMFIRNDKEGRWINGTLGRVCNVDDDRIMVELENGNVYDVEPETWENMQYAFDEEKKVVIENVLGTFKQLPIKPAWAITIHKSQGLTFNNIVIDFAGGAFSSGQTYVALSRCTSLEGIVMLRAIDERDIIVNTNVVEFSRHFNDISLINNAMNSAKAKTLYAQASRAFDKGDFRGSIDSLAQAITIENISGSALAKRFAAMKLSKITKLQQSIGELQAALDEKNKVLDGLAAEYVAMGCDAVNIKSGEVDCDVDDMLAVKAAVANFDKAMRISTNCVAAMIGKAKLLMAIDETESALDLLTRAMKSPDAGFDGIFTLAMALYKNNEVKAAIKVLKRAAKADKNSTKPHEVLLEIYMNMGLEDLADEQRDAISRIRKRQSKKKK